MKYPDYPFVQTKNSVQYDELLSDFAQQEVFKMICSSDIWAGTKVFSNGWKIPTEWSDIGVVSNSLESAFASFRSSYNNQGGSVVEDDYNAALSTAVKVN